MNNISGVSNIESILEENGYPISRGANYISTAGLWRNGDNNTAICIYPEENLVIDFVTSEKFSIHTLIGKILGIEGEDNINEYLSNNNLNFAPKQEITEPLIKSPKYKNKEFLSKLTKDHSYWLCRKIKLEVLEELGGGLYKNKYYFPILDKDKNLLGWSARIIRGETDKKYIVAGEKKNFLYPFSCLDEIVKSKEVWIHEGIPDLASLMSINVRNNLCQFGVELSFTVVNFLLRIPDVRINLVQNNDKPNKFGIRPGEHACEKNKRKLLRYFDHAQVRIKTLPKEYKDLNDLLTKESEEMLIKWTKTC